MRGWIILYSLLGAGSLSASAFGFDSWGFKSLGAIAFMLALLGLISTVVRGRA